MPRDERRSSSGDVSFRFFLVKNFPSLEGEGLGKSPTLEFQIESRKRLFHFLRKEELNRRNWRTSFLPFPKREKLRFSHWESRKEILIPFHKREELYCSFLWQTKICSFLEEVEKNVPSLPEWRELHNSSLRGSDGDWYLLVFFWRGRERRKIISSHI